MNDLTKVLLPLLVSPLLSVIAALITIYYRLRQERQNDREKEKEHIRLKILNPLLVASEDLLGRMTDIKRRRNDHAKSDDMQYWFKDIKDKARQDQRAFAFWANDEGYFAMSTLYMTAVYFHYAGRIRRDFPFIELASGGETALLFRLSEVRISIGGKFGIWEVMQDSLGAYLTAADSSVRNYRQFCELIISETEAVWFNRLIDFYRDIHMKLDDHLGNIERSLRELILFLRNNLRIAAVEYRLIEASIADLRRQAVPARMVEDLGPLVGKDYLKEVDFVDALVGRIGQDMADDYKPSILKCADRRLV